MSRSYREIYSSQDIISKKLCFSAAMVNFNPVTVISSLNAPKARPIVLSNFTDLQMSEITEYLSNYNEKPYVTVAQNEAYVILPSLFPTSTSCLLLRMDVEPKIFLRFVKEKPELFVLASDITVAPARMSKRLDAQRKEFFDFCSELERTFMYLERFNLSFGNREVIDGYYEQIIAISSFLAVPIEDISVNNNDDGVPIKSNFALFTAFCTTIMMLARNEAIDRRICVELKIFGGSIVVNMSFKTERNIRVTNETFLWDYLASSRRMLFEYYNENDRFCVSFEPLFIDWSYLEMKQNKNADALLSFEE